MCQRCCTEKPKLTGECFHCGEPGCSDCFELREDLDHSTGYRGGELVCSDPCCIKDREEAAELAREESPAITYPEGVLCPF